MFVHKYKYIYINVIIITMGYLFALSCQQVVLFMFLTLLLSLIILFVCSLFCLINFLNKTHTPNRTSNVCHSIFMFFFLFFLVFFCRFMNLFFLIFFSLNLIFSSNYIFILTWSKIFKILQIKNKQKNIMIKLKFLKHLFDAVILFFARGLEGLNKLSWVKVFFPVNIVHKKAIQWFRFQLNNIYT